MPKYTRDRVIAAFNRAASEAQELEWTGDSEDVTDATNLVVNLGLHYVEHPEATLRQAIEANYGDAAEFLLVVTPQERVA